MALRVPVSVEVEYRGKAQPGDFVNDDGEKIEYAAKLKFEYEDDEGDVSTIPVPGSQLDKVTPPVDYESFTKGDRFTLNGFAMLQERGSGKASYLSVSSLIPATATAAKLRQAS